MVVGASLNNFFVYTSESVVLEVCLNQPIIIMKYLILVKPLALQTFLDSRSSEFYGDSRVSG